MPIVPAAVTASTPEAAISAATFDAWLFVKPAACKLCVPPNPKLRAAPEPKSLKNPPTPACPAAIGVQFEAVKNAPSPVCAPLPNPPAAVLAALAAFAALVAPPTPAPCRACAPMNATAMFLRIFSFG